MTPEEFAVRRSLEIIDATIKALCLQRDLLAASLPNAPKPKISRVCPVSGMEIKKGGGRPGKREVKK